MYISENFKQKLIKAKEAGYKNVYSICGAYKATTYCVFRNIDILLDYPIGTLLRSRPQCCQNMWTGHANTRMVDSTNIMYSEIFKRF